MPRPGITDMTSNSFCERLIQLVHDVPSLYDVTHPQYSDPNLKSEIWNRIGEELNLEGLACKAKWNNMRDTYRKSLKKAKSKPVRRYRYADQMHFLKKYFKNDTASGAESSSDGEGLKQDDFRMEEESEPDVSVGKEKKRVKEEVELTPDPLNYELHREDVQAYCMSSMVHPVDAFLAGVAPILKSLSPRLLSLAKMDIYKTVHKYEMQNIIEWTPPRTPSTSKDPPNIPSSTENV